MFYDIYERLCKEKGVTPTKASAEIGFAKGSVSYWKKKRNEGIDARPDSYTATKIADYFGVSTDYVLGRERSNLTPATMDRDVAEINVYGTIPAGLPVEAIEDVVDTEQIPSKWLRGGREYFALRVDGDSMYPEYLPGDTVIVRKSSTCNSGDDCVVYINGYNATLKRIKLHDDGCVEVCPLNTNYSPRRYTPQEVETLPIKIGGVVVELRRKKK